MQASHITALVLGLTAALTGLPLFRSCVRSPITALYLVGGIWAISEAFDLPVWSLSGFSFTAFDLVNIVVAAAAAVRLTREVRSRVLLLAFVAIAMYVLAFVRGILSYSASGELEFSSHLLILTGLLYGSTFRGSEIEWGPISTALQRLAGTLLLILALKQVGFINGTGGTTLSASSAFLVAQALLAKLVPLGSRPRFGSWWSGVWVCVLIGGVVVLQHRTVWVALIIALVAFALLSARALVVLGAGVMTMVLLVAIMSAVGFQGTRDSYEGGTLVQELQGAANSRSTFDWRTERWRDTLETNASRGTAAVVFGSGYGARWVEVGSQVDRTEPPHSQYVEIAVRFGIVGVALWLFLYGITLTRLRRMVKRTTATGSPDAVRAVFFYLVVITQLLWSISYSLNSIQPILLGLAIGLSISKVASTSASVRSSNSLNDRKHIPRTMSET